MKGKERLPIGGYVSMKKYGKPDYCPSATRHHKKAKAETGKTPNAIWFKSVREAIKSGYSPCGNCWLVGEKALKRWQQYLDICEQLGLNPIPTPKKISNKTAKN